MSGRLITKLHRLLEGSGYFENDTEALATALFSGWLPAITSSLPVMCQATAQANRRVKRKRRSFSDRWTLTREGGGSVFIGHLETRFDGKFRPGDLKIKKFG